VVNGPNIFQMLLVGDQQSNAQSSHKDDAVAMPNMKSVLHMQ